MPDVGSWLMTWPWATVVLAAVDFSPRRLLVARVWAAASSCMPSMEGTETMVTAGVWLPNHVTAPQPTSASSAMTSAVMRKALPLPPFPPSPSPSSWPTAGRPAVFS